MLTEFQCREIWQNIQHSHRPLLSFVDGDRLQSLPLQVLQDSFDGTFWFLMSKRQMLTWDLQVNDPVCLMFRNNDNRLDVCLYGIANFTGDRNLLEKFWRVPFNNRFPGGPQDADCVLLEIFIEKLETWNYPECLPAPPADRKKTSP